jgi:hypothetical protein
VYEFMRTTPSRVLLLCMLPSLVILIACERHDAPTRHPETYVATQNAVGFDILPLGNADGTRRWIATYTKGGSSTKFRIEIPAATDADQAGSGAGKLLRESGSDPIPLLDDLKKALRAKGMPKGVKNIDELPFTYTTVDENRRRSANGTFAENSKGNWTVLKVSMGKGAEVFLDLDTFDHQAEFSIADPDHGDAVLAEFAKVL